VIRDDGKGIDAQTIHRQQPTGHFGLPGMRERAAVVKGDSTSAARLGWHGDRAAGAGRHGVPVEPAVAMVAAIWRHNAGKRGRRRGVIASVAVYSVKDSARRKEVGLNLAERRDPEQRVRKTQTTL
jgi:hypothetical protein